MKSNPKQNWLFISQESGNNIIVSEQDFQLHFIDNKLYMWTIAPQTSFFSFKKKETE